MLHTIHTTAAPAAVGPYAQAVRSGHFLFMSGQLGLDPTTGCLREGMEDQTRQALANVEAILAAAGGTWAEVVSVDVFLTDMGSFAEFNAIYAAVLGEHRPARAVVGVAALPLGAAVEIRAVAVLATL